MDVPTLLLTTRSSALAPLLRDLSPAALAAAVPSVVGVCSAGGAAAALVFISVLLEKGCEIRPAELIALSQAVANALGEVGRCDVPADVVCRVSAGVAAAAMQAGAPRSALKSVAALLSSALAPNVLTAAHVDFVKLALAARAYDPGAAALSALPVHSVSEGSTPRDVLLFHYYGGLLFCGAEDWAQAAGFFKTCISLPGPGTSAIQLEAFKKLLLALAIDPRNVARGTGSFHAPPSAVVASLPRHRRDGLATLARAYVDLVNALERFDSAAVLKSAAEHAALFERDGNAGLVHVVVADKMPLLQLLRLRRVYAAVPLAVVAKTLGVKVDGVVGAVFRTISRGGLDARVDEARGALEFSPHEESSEGFIADSPELAAHLQARVDAALGQLSHLKQADRDLQLSDAFRSRAAGGAGGGSKRGPSARRHVSQYAEGSNGAAADFFGGDGGEDDDADMILARAASMLT